MKITDIFENNEIPTNPFNAFEYAKEYYERTGERCYEAERNIITSPDAAAMYAAYVIKKPWPEAEPTIMTISSGIYAYAKDVIKGRWPEAEHIILEDTIGWAKMYVEWIIIKPFMNSKPKSKQIFKLLMEVTKLVGKHKNDYDYLIKLIFPDSSIMADKWINYGNRQRDKI